MSRILFVMLHPGFIRYYEGALHALADAGHDVHVAFEISRTKLGEDVTARRLATSSQRITCGTTPERLESVRDFLARGDRTATRSGDGASTAGGSTREQAWESLATTIRLLADYLRFFEPAFATAERLRARAEKRLPRIYRSPVRFVAGAGAIGRSALAATLRALERVIPTAPSLDAFVREQNPDVLLVTPLIELGSQQVDYVKSARVLGVRSALCVASWDNLTSKGLIRVVPDHVVVWNETQKHEATTLHGVPSDRVVVTGAQLFDRWFDARPTRSRDEFCRMVGLDPDRPFVLYVGSSSFIAPDEVPFAERWLSRLRGSDDPAVASAGVLIRPHPANSRQWRTFDQPAFGNAAVWPPIGTDPNAQDFARDYFESLYYSSAVIGINTSALIEAGIVDRPVFTVRAPEFAHAQAGTLHFQHLVGHGHGLVRAADTLQEHVEQLAAHLSGRHAAGDEARAFIQSFVRPKGLDVPVVPIFTRAIEEIARSPRPTARRDPLWVSAVRPLTLPMAYVARALADDRPLWVIALRPFLASGIWAAALAYRVQEVWRESGHTVVKRLRRAAWRMWYESSQSLRSWRRRVNRKVTKAARVAGGAAKRAVRREL